MSKKQVTNMADFCADKWHEQNDNDAHRQRVMEFQDSPWQMQVQNIINNMEATYGEAAYHMIVDHLKIIGVLDKRVKCKTNVSEEAA